MNRNQQNIVFLQSGDPETENRAPDSYSAGQLGNLLTVADRSDSSKSKQYRLVQADSSMAVAPSEGAVAWWRNRANYVVTTDATLAGRGNIAGVFRTAVDGGNICCIQRRGQSTVQVQTGTPSTAGLHVIPSATSGKADVLAAGNAATYPKLGLSISAASGSPSAFTAALDVEDGMAEG